MYEDWRTPVYVERNSELPGCVLLELEICTPAGLHNRMDLQVFGLQRLTELTYLSVPFKAVTGGVLQSLEGLRRLRKLQLAVNDAYDRGNYLYIDKNSRFTDMLFCLPDEKYACDSYLI